MHPARSTGRASSWGQHTVLFPQTRPLGLRLAPGQRSGATGAITQWHVIAARGGFVQNIQTTNIPHPQFNDVSDQGVQTPFEGIVDGNPGLWTTPAVPDVGSSLALLSFSLTALGVAARQFKRAAA